MQKNGDIEIGNVRERRKDTLINGYKRKRHFQFKFLNKIMLTIEYNLIWVQKHVVEKRGIQ